MTDRDERSDRRSMRPLRPVRILRTRGSSPDEAARGRVNHIDVGLRRAASKETVAHVRQVARDGGERDDASRREVHPRIPDIQPIASYPWTSRLAVASQEPIVELTVPYSVPDAERFVIDITRR